VGLLCLAPAAAQAGVDVALVPEAPAALAGDTIRLRLVLTADSATAESFASLRILLDWDPAQLHLLGQDRTGAVSLLTSGFPHDPANLNELTATGVPQDGDAVYVAFAPLGNAVAVDQEGTFITTLLFETLGPAPTVAVAIPASAGVPTTVSTVFSGTVPNMHITGTLSGASVPVFEQPTRLVLTLPDHGVPAGQQIVATLSMENLNGQEAAGFAAALRFDPAELAFIDGLYTAAPFGSTVITPIMAHDGALDLAASISPADQPPTAADAELAVLTFQTIQGGCVSSLAFRDAIPPSRITTMSGAPIGPLILVNPVPPDPAVCNCPCELDAAPGVDVFDLLAYLDCWFAPPAGCG
jgi:hypothetical protein